MNSICIECINDKSIKEYIYKNGYWGTCSFCASKNKVISDFDLKPVFEFVENLYIYETQTIPKPQDFNEYENCMISVIQSDWNVFNEKNIDAHEQLRFYKEMFNYYRGVFNNPEIVKKLNLGSHGIRFIAESNESNIYWNSFCNHIKYNRRYFYENYFLAEDSYKYLLNDSFWTNYEKVIDKDLEYYRARIGYEKKENFNIFPYAPKNMGAPPNNLAKSGRANPDGIAYLYAADTKTTAVAEVRPWKGAKITIAKLKPKRKLKMISFMDFPKPSSPFESFLKDKPKEFEREFNDIKLVKRLAEQLSTPTNPEKSHIEYIPTQFLVELILHKGYDGIIFKSSLGEGKILFFLIKKILIFLKQK